MKKLFILFLLYNFNIIYSSENSNSKVSTNEFMCKVFLEPKDPDEICPTPATLGDINNFLKNIEEFVNGQSKTEVTFSSYNQNHKKMVRLTIMRHDETPLMITYILKNSTNSADFEDQSIWGNERESIGRTLNEILDKYNQEIFTEDDINTLEEIIHAKTDNYFPRADSSTNIIPAPYQNPNIPVKGRSQSYQEPIPEIPPLTQYYGQPYYPKAFLDTSSPEPENPVGWRNSTARRRQREK